MLNATLRRAWLGSGICLALLLAWDALGLDLVVMHWLGDADGFPLRHHPLLEHWLHDRARQVGVAAFLALWLACMLPVGPLSAFERPQRWRLAVSVSLALATVNLIKNASLTSCPWELTDFGGVAAYISHWRWGLPDGGGGRCFPGGHASAALAFLPLSLPWLLQPDEGRKRVGVRLLIGVLAVGCLLGLVQTLRGAHYPSHTAWTALICWTCGLSVETIGRWRQISARSVQV